MSGSETTIWWPFQEVTTGSGQNNELEFWFRDGATYHPGGGSEAATGNEESIAAASLPWPIAFDGWEHVHDLLQAIRTAMLGAADQPVGLTVAVSVSKYGIASITCSHEFKFDASDAPTVKILGELGFNISADDYSTTKTATAIHDGGFYLRQSSNDYAGLSEYMNGHRGNNPAEIQTLDGSVFGVADGDPTGVMRLAFEFLNSDQLAQLEQCWQWAHRGRPVAVQAESYSFTDHELGHILAADSRGAFDYERVAPAVDLYRLRWNLLQRTGGS